MPKTVEYDVKILKKRVFWRFPLKSIIPCIFQVLGLIPLDPERICGPFRYWKSGKSSAGS